MSTSDRGQPDANAVARATRKGFELARDRIVPYLGGRRRTRVIVLLACVLALSSADTATVGAAAVELRSALHVGNADIGLLVAVTAVVAAVFSLPFGVLADRMRRTFLLGIAILAWSVAMVWSATAGSFAELLYARLALGGVSAAAGPVIASLVGDWFLASERGHIYSYVLTGELLGAGVGFAVTGDIAALSWRLAFVVLALPAVPVAWAVFHLQEPPRGGAGALLPEPGSRQRTGGGLSPQPAAPGQAFGPGSFRVAEETGAERAGAGGVVAPAGRSGAPGARDALGEVGAASGGGRPPPAGGPTRRAGAQQPRGWTGRAGPRKSPREAAAPPPESGATHGTGVPPPRRGTPRNVKLTDAQRLVLERGIQPNRALAARASPGMGFKGAVGYVLAVRTNVALIVAGAFGYYFLAGVETFGEEFVSGQYHVAQVVANLFLVVVGTGAVTGVLVAGPLGDRLLHGGRVSGRVMVAAVSASLAVVLLVPAFLTHSALGALPYIALAAACLSAQNPPIDAARLDIVPSWLWGRAEGVRTFLRTAAQALAPLLFGVFSEYLFGGGHKGLYWTFIVMLVPLSASATYLYFAAHRYPKDVATAVLAAQAAERRQ